MNKSIKILTAIAVIQLFLTAMTWVGNTDLKSNSDKGDMLVFDQKDIDVIVIKDTENEIKLSKKDGKWQTSDDFPAFESKIESLLTQLDGLEYNLPVATSSQALKRFKVAKDDFEREVLLQKNGKELARLYLGSSAGVRQTHARSGKQDAVYLVSMGVYDLPVKKSEWQDKTILKLEKNSVTSIEFSELNLVKDDSQGDDVEWKMKQVDKNVAENNTNFENNNLDQNVINDALSKLLSLNFSEVLGKQKNDNYGLEEPALKVSVKHNSEDRIYEFGKLKDSDNYVLKVSDRDEFFQIASYTAKPIIEIFVKDKWLIEASKVEDKKTESTDLPSTPSDIVKGTK